MTKSTNRNDKETAKAVKTAMEMNQSIDKRQAEKAKAAPKVKVEKTPKAAKMPKPPAEPKVKAPKVEKVMPFCECGCGIQTKGGRFRPGHDAKLHSQRLAETRPRPEDMMAEKLANKYPFEVLAKAVALAETMLASKGEAA